MALTKPDETENPTKSRALSILGPGLINAIGEARKWPSGLARQPLQAKAFYATLAIATLVGVGLNFTLFNPIQALFWSAAGGRRHDRCGSRYDRHCSPIAQVLSRNSAALRRQRFAILQVLLRNYDQERVRVIFVHIQT